MTGRQRTTHEAAEIHALRATGMSTGQIGEQLDIPKRTVAAIVAGEGRWRDIIENDTQFVRWKDDVTRKLQTGALALATKSFLHAEEQLPKANYYQAIVGGSILIDKARLLGNESTENLAVRVTGDDIATREDVLARVATLLARDGKETEAT